MVGLQLAGREIRNVAVIDDDESVREGYSEALEDLGLTPLALKGPLEPVGLLFDTTLSGCEAIVTDLGLKGSGYADYDGGALAVEAKRRGKGLVMFTTYSDVNQKLHRFERRSIPSILPRDQFRRDLPAGLTMSFEEIDGRFTRDRRPWRTQVKVVDVDEDQRYVWVVVMGRSPDERVAIHLDELPKDVREAIKRDRKTLHAKVNTGAKKASDLYFDDWEPR